MPLSLKAIRPKKLSLIDTSRTVENIKKGQRAFARAVVDDMTKYPSQKTTPAMIANAVSRYEQGRGWKVRRYKRTKKLAIGWLLPSSIKIAPDGSSVTITNPVRYAVYVQGPKGGGRGVGQRQTRDMRARGWPSITDVARKRAKQYKEIMNRSLKGSPTGF